METQYEFTPIARVHSCFKETFGIPRQPNLARDAPGLLVFEPKFANPEAIRELQGFSHIWLIFVFHAKSSRKWQPMVRPPRLGGNQKVGVFASRSPFRPNPIGMSVVGLTSVETTSKGPVLHLKGVDILDQTPVLDIKPYLPYSDGIHHATGGFAPDSPEAVPEISFSPGAVAQCRELEGKIPDLKSIITQVLENDPRPAYFKSRSDEINSSTESLNQERIFGMKLFNFDLKWIHRGNGIHVISLDPISSG